MMKQVIHKFFDGLILSLPLLIMSLLCIVTWWLVLIAPEIPSMSKKKVLRDTPDLIMNNFTVERFDESGALRSTLKAIQAQRIPLNKEVMLNNVDLMTTEVAEHNGMPQPVLNTPGIEFYRTTAIADRGFFYNDDSMIELVDNAYVTRQPYLATGNEQKLEFRGNELKIMLAENGKLYSDQPVEITQEGTQFTANTMTYDYLTNTLHMIGRVIGNSDQLQQ